MTPVITLTVDELVSYERSYLNVADRKGPLPGDDVPPAVRSGPGQPRTIEVRYPGTAQDGPFETHDMTDICCRHQPGLDCCSVHLGSARYLTHTVS